MPANTNVYTGADGSISLSVPQGGEGDAAQTVLTAYDLITVGRVQSVRVEVRSEIKAYNELGSRYPTQLRPGNVTITGTIGRAFINGALLKLLLGEAATTRPATSWTQPAFNITLLVENAAVPGVRSAITLHDVKISNWVYELPEDDVVMESADFTALFIDTADEPA
jgi:hypothetical protein